MDSSKIIIGRHVSFTSPDYLLGSAKEAIFNQYSSFMIYLGSPRSSLRIKTSLLKLSEFKSYISENSLNIENVVVHGSYLVNIANTLDEKKLKWSVNFLSKELDVMNEIGLKTIVIHPGSSLGVSKEIALLNIVNSLNEILSENSNVRIALETMSGRTNELGTTFEELQFIISRIRYKNLVGVCWDTCHLYSAGYDIKNNLDQIIEEFDQKIGIEKLWVIHINDSLYEFNSRKDRHANIGKGEIGVDSLRKIVNHTRILHAIKLLETPRKDEYYKKEIDLLRSNRI